MGSEIKNAVIFVAGAVIGSVATWYAVKTKYAKIAQEEIDSVKETYSASKTEEEQILTSRSEFNEFIEQKKEDRKNYNDTIKNLNYASTSEKGGDEYMTDRPYVIKPEDFGETFDYETVSLIYYADKVLTDENDDIIDDVDETVGLESLTHFGEYEDDSVFVRNDAKKTDYEILLDTRNYYDIYPAGK